jgi:hypothetical protein
MPETTRHTQDVLIDFEHHQTAHCESGATSGLLRFHGLELSEPMAFGIGGGLFFGYFPFMQLAHVRVTTFRKLPGTVICKAFKRLNMRYHSETFFRRASAREALDEALDAGKPVACQVGFYWLPYVPRALRTHFNAHHIVLYGRRGDTYLVSEPGLDTVQTVQAADLERARFSRGGMNPRGRLYWLKEDRSPKTRSLARPVAEGIKDVCFNMLIPPIPLLGVRGIRSLGRDILKWRNRLSEDQVRDNLNQIVIMQEVVGSGGAGFRYMYAAFLSEAAQALETPALAEASRGMTRIGDRWRDFALVATRFVKGRPNAGDNYAAMASMVLDLADREKLFFQGLWKLAKAIKA